MRVLGIDCGTERTGYGVIDSDGRFHRMLAAGVIRTDTREPLEIRLLAIGRGIRDIIRSYSPECAAVEDVFHAVNAKTVIKLAHARGVALMAFAEAGIPLGSYSPMQVKRSVVGFGRAEKEQVQMMVRSLLGLDAELPSQDASDAVAVAICHANYSATRSLLRPARTSSPKSAEAR
jgi:crossover junction endodeoxyribonuclease RuvC